MTRPKTITDFQNLGKSRRGGRTAKQCKDLHDLRAARRQLDEQPRLLCWTKHLIQLGTHTMQPVCYTRAKNWTSDVPTTGRTREKAENHGRYSSRCTFDRYTYTLHIESWGIVVRGHLRFTIATSDGRQTTLLQPWRGWHWIVDAHGIALVDARGGRDYHPTASDLLEHPSTREMATLAREMDQRRRKAQRVERQALAGIKRAEREGARVCIVDSMRAGNCYAGSRNWAERHGLVSTQHYRPTEVLALANGDTRRVQLVVAVALKRHRAEMRAGCCQLTDHVFVK